MTQTFEKIYYTDKINESLSKILSRDESALTASSGNNFPQDVTEEQIGRICDRTDLKALYCLKSVEPRVWELMLDYSSVILDKNQVDSEFQRKSETLTYLSQITPDTNKVPYFTSNTSVGTFTLTDFAKGLLNCNDSASMRSYVGFGNLATLDYVGTNNVISKSITVDKLAFEPVLKSELLSTGDFKESLVNEVQDGWILYQSGSSIGNTGSGATNRANADVRSLFDLLWLRSDVKLQDSSGNDTTKGSNSTSDWNDLKRLVLPDFSTQNKNTYLLMRL